jgi:hypothetical protein
VFKSIQNTVNSWKETSTNNMLNAKSKIKDNTENIKENVNFNIFLFKENCIDEWYLFISEVMLDIIRSIMAFLAMLAVGNFFYSGFIGTILFFGLGLVGVYFILEPIINIFIFIVRCVGYKRFNYI